jgi:hypothetical protein
LSEQLGSENKSANKKNAFKAKGNFIAVLAAVVVACSFSFAIGFQQAGGGNATSVPNQMGASAQTIESAPGEQSVNQNLTSGDNMVQEGVGVNNQDQSNSENYKQQYSYNQGNQPLSGGSEERMESFGHGGRHGGHGGFSSQQNGVVTSQNYNATPERCCATGKTGTCHAW